MRITFFQLGKCQQKMFSFSRDFGLGNYCSFDIEIGIMKERKHRQPGTSFLAVRPKTSAKSVGSSGCEGPFRVAVNWDGFGVMPMSFFKENRVFLRSRHNLLQQKAVSGEGRQLWSGNWLHSQKLKEQDWGLTWWGWFWVKNHGVQYKKLMSFKKSILPKESKIL